MLLVADINLKQQRTWLWCSRSVYRLRLVWSYGQFLLLPLMKSWDAHTFIVLLVCHSTRLQKHYYISISCDNQDRISTAFSQNFVAFLDFRIIIIDQRAARIKINFSILAASAFRPPPRKPRASHEVPRAQPSGLGRQPSQGCRGFPPPYPEGQRSQ